MGRTTINNLTPSPDDGEGRLLERIQSGDESAVAELFMNYRPRLKRMVAARMDPRIRGRVDESDVLQEAFLEFSRRAQQQLLNTEMPFFLWTRMVTGQKLLEIHRRHITVQARSVQRETLSKYGPGPSHASLAEHLAGDFSTASRAAQNKETRETVQLILESLSDEDREVLTLRHYEELSNVEVAAIMEVTEATASARYIRALRKLKSELAKSPGFSDQE